MTKSSTASEINGQVQDTPARQGSIFADYTFDDAVLKGFGLGAGVLYAGPKL